MVCDHDVCVMEQAVRRSTDELFQFQGCGTVAIRAARSRQGDTPVEQSPLTGADDAHALAVRPALRVVAWLGWPEAKAGIHRPPDAPPLRQAFTVTGGVPSPGSGVSSSDPKGVSR